MQVKSKLKCPGCDVRTEASFRKPEFMGRPTIINVICSGCNSDLSFKLTRKSTKGDIHTQAEILMKSETLVAMLKEEAEHRAKPIEEQVS